MKKYEIYIIEMLLFISIIMFNIVYKSNVMQCVSIVLIALYAIKRYGIMKDNNYLKNSVVKTTISCILFYFVTIYLLGLLLGYMKTILVFSFSYFINIILIQVISIVFIELLRYIICRNTQHKKIPLIIYTILLVILDIIIEIKGYNIKDHEVFFIFITTIVIPSIAKQSICSYLTYKVSYKPSMIYNLTISLYQFVLPIIPNLGNYLYATTSIALPYIIYYFTSKINNYKKKSDNYHKEVIRRLIYIPVFICLIILVILVSGIFRHTIIAVGSNSMAPVYERGDAIIYSKTDIKDIKVGEIIAFRREGKIVTHRVINKKKDDYTYIFYTKGDANRTPDAFEVKDSEVLGVVKIRIKYIGYPTIWFNAAYEGKEIE